MISQKQLKYLWKIGYDNFFYDLEKFILEWETNLKKCNCDNLECKHYQKEKIKRFEKRTNVLFKSSILINAKSFLEINKKYH